MGRSILQLSSDDKRLIALRSVLAYALREVSAIENPPKAAVDGLAVAYRALDEAATDAIDPDILDAVKQSDLSDLN